ncbi:MAG: HEAT repeat domain-containing protein [Planctomycetales bacterium]|nr:HEAT repeat domain-containing protein [Planctomycetales bacterium]
MRRLSSSSTVLVLVLGALTALLPPALAQEYAKPIEQPLGPETRPYDQEHLALDLRVDIERGTVEGTATHRLRVLRDGIRDLPFHGKDLEVSSATTGDPAAPPGLASVPCAVARKDDLVLVSLPRPAKLGETLEVKIRYRAAPKRGLWFFRPTKENPETPLQVWSQGQGEDNRHWIPCYDLPDDRLTTEIRATVPAGLAFVSNGEPAAPPAKAADGWETHHWRQALPHATYLVSLIAGRFDEVAEKSGAVPLQYYLPPGLGKLAPVVFGRTPKMVAFFEDYTGRKYPWPRYAQTTVWDFLWGGMENTGATTLNMRAIYDEAATPDYSADGLISHELAHMWFGDLLTCRTWAHMWLNEGFATYFTDLWFEHEKGREEFLAIRRASQRGLASESLDRLADLPAAKPGEPRDMSGGKAYSRGAAVLHQLRHLLGDDVFREGIRRWVKDHPHEVVVSEQLREAMEAVSGRDLSWFFEQWVYGSGFPDFVVRADWEEGTKTLVLRARQSQPVRGGVGLFRTPVEVEAVAAGTTWRHRLEIHRDYHEWRIPLPGKPDRVRWDRGAWVLSRVDFRKPLAWWAAQLRDDDDATGRIEAAEALADFGAEAVAPLSSAATGDKMWAVRKAAVEALPKAGGAAARPALTLAASDAESRVRTAAVKALGELPGAASESDALLLARLREDGKEYVRAAAAEALGKSKAPGALEALKQALSIESHRDEIRTAAVKALAALGEKGAVGDIRPFVEYAWGKGGQHALRREALAALVSLAKADPQTVPTLARLARDPYFRMRGWALDHLKGYAPKPGSGASAPKEVVEAVRWIAENDPIPGNRDSAKAALRDLLGTPPEPAAPSAGPTPAERAERAAAMRREAAKLRLDSEAGTKRATELEAEARKIEPASEK